MANRQALDLSLLQRARAGDGSAFVALYQYYQSFIFNKILGMVGNRLDAEDLTSEVFEKVLRNLAKYKPTFTFNTWLNRVDKNHVLDYLDRQHMAFNDIECALTFRCPDPRPDEHLTNDEDRRMLEALFCRLTPRQSTCVRLFYYEDYTYNEISAEFGLDLNHVCALVYRGRQAMRELLTKNCA